VKILQINSANSFGGGEKHFVDLTQGLNDRDHEIYVAMRPNAVWRKQLNFISHKHIFLLPLRSSLDLSSAWQLAQLIKREKIDIVHAHLARDYPLAALGILLSQTDTKLVLTRHVLFNLNRFYKFLLPSNTIFIAVSKAVQEKLQIQKIVPEKNVQLVLNGVNTKHFEVTKKTFNREVFCKTFNLSPQNLLVGIIGEITEHKGQTEFVRAAVFLTKQWPEVNFLIVGQDGSAKKQHLRKLENLVDKFQLTEKFRFLGWFNDVAPILAGLDVFVSASRVEPFGLVIVEAMAAGCAVVATQTEGACEILQDNFTGRLVPIGDIASLAKAVHELLTDENKRNFLRANAKKIARENFDSERMVIETEQIYKNHYNSGS
jgi:glycosyltransferase involved in cell wall biosynthesis